MRLFNKKKKKKTVKSPLLRQLPQAIVYLSDLFVFLMILTWMYYIINGTIAGWYQIIKTEGTYASVFTELKDACTIPLTAGGVAWLIRCAANHITASMNGKNLKFDFPNLDENGNVVGEDPFVKKDKEPEEDSLYTESDDMEAKG